VKVHRRALESYRNAVARMEDHELSNLATHLHTLVSKFRVNANGGGKQRKQSDAGDEYSSSQEVAAGRPRPRNGRGLAHEKFGAGASKKCAQSKHAAAQSEELFQVVSFNLAEEEYGLPILTAHPYVRH
jgi:hypothetical protein